MDREHIVALLRENENALRELGVEELELFGSTARGDRTPTSDVDLLVTFREPAGLFTFYRTESYLETLLGSLSVDLVLKRAVVEEFQAQILSEAIPCLAVAGQSA